MSMSNHNPFDGWNSVIGHTPNWKVVNAWSEPDFQRGKNSIYLSIWWKWPPVFLFRCCGKLMCHWITVEERHCTGKDPYMYVCTPECKYKECAIVRRFAKCDVCGNRVAMTRCNEIFWSDWDFGQNGYQGDRSVRRKPCWINGRC